MRKIKRRHKIIVRFVREQLFDADVILIYSRWEDIELGAKKFLVKEKLKYLMDKVKKHGNEPTVRAVQFPMQGGGSVIWAGPYATVGCLIHECLHVVAHLLRSRDIPFTTDTEEVYAYLIDFLFTNLVKGK